MPVLPSARLRPALLVLVLALVSACGSTVQVKGQAVLGGPGGELGGSTGLGGPAQPGGQGLSGTGTTGAVAGAPGTVAGGSGGSSYTGTTGAAAPGTPGSSSRLPKGVTATTISIGVIHDSSADTVNQAAGVGAISHGDDLGNYRAIQDDINKHGGLGGRKLELVVAPFSSASAQTLDQQWAAVCQVFTRDHPVFLADNAGSQPSYWDCLQRAGVGLIDSGLPTMDAATLARHPAMLQLGYPSIDRLAQYTVPSLVEQKYFTPWNSATGNPAPTGTVKVGIYTYDDPIFAGAVDRYLVPALKKLGYTPVVAKIAQANGASDYGAQASAVKSAQLTFAANGVTHVIPFESNGGLSTFFLPTARSQGFYPRYGISSATGFEALKEAGVADNQQFNGAVGFGWIPSIDLPAARNGVNEPWSSANRRYCLKVMRDHGITFDSGNAEAIALSSCTDLYLMKAALDRVGRNVSLTAFIQAAEGLGTSYQPASGIGIAFRPGRQDPAQKAWHWQWFGDCTCFHYTGSPVRVP